MPNRLRCRKSLLALAAGAALLPSGAWALDLAQSPPASVKPYVAPNVIISVDDSGSMGWPVGGSGPRRNDARMNVLKDALRSTFSDQSLLPDRQIRLAWQAMWNNGGSRGAGNVNQPGMAENSMRPLESTHRTNFRDFVNRLRPSGGTPSHPMFKQADAYMRRGLDQNSPWASKPGEQGAPYLACRRNYHIFMSDGRWNTYYDQVPPSGEGDSFTQTLPDGKTYNKQRPYADNANGTLADWAFYSWAKPLQTSGLTGQVKTTDEYNAAPATESFGPGATLDKYWNPKYNPATWANMVTYTIGFSNDAVTWPGDPTIIAPTQKVPFDYTGSFPDLVTGARWWPAMSLGESVRALDLWHAALNGRGRFYAVEQAEDLEKAFREILGKINSENKPGTSSAATSGSSVSRSDVGQYVAEYDPTKGWSGTIKAYKVKADGTTEAEGAPWDAAGTAKKLDDLSNAAIASRVVLSWGDATAVNRGVPFKWASDESRLSTAQKTALGGQDQLNYLRGDKSKQRASVDDTTQPFRWRASRQGDIVNSQVWYTGRPVSNHALPGYSAFTRINRNRTPMLYVGGNDGMLHGFSVKDGGTELLAYVPRGVYGNLKKLTEPNYSHRYFVDGSPMTGDVNIANNPSDTTIAPDWRTLLVGTLGAGGRGYFVLDVTNPDKEPDGTNIKAPKFAEGNAAQLVVMDRTLLGNEATAPDPDDANADLGHVTAAPVRDEDIGQRAAQITRLNDDRWAVVMGNGYNSANQRPVLLIQYLDGAKELLRIPVTTDAAGTGEAQDNGLAAPQLVDLNGDGRADVVYAGDNRGNLWKFDLTAITPGEDANGIVTGTGWKVAFGGQPLFTAEHGSGPSAKRQPISAPPIVRANDRMQQVGTGASLKTVPVGGMMVAFGTGRNVTTADPGSTDVQTLYSVLDNTRYKVIDTALGKRLQVHPGHSCGGTTGCTDVPAPAPLGTGVGAAKLAKQKVTGSASGKGGLAADTPSQELKLETWKDFNGWYLDFPVAGERLLKPMSFYDGSNVLAVYSQVPQRPSGSAGDATVESCDEVTVNGEQQFRTFVNIMDGKNPRVPLMDGNADGVINHLDAPFSRTNTTAGTHNIVTTGPHSAGDVDDKNKIEKLARFPEQALRPVWRQLQ
ncbi:MAG: pilus assembly protein PilC [Ottowia sp.]|nr:pilus assembly protein PilC [Ottowia sp.]